MSIPIKKVSSHLSTDVIERALKKLAIYPEEVVDEKSMNEFVPQFPKKEQEDIEGVMPSVPYAYEKSRPLNPKYKDKLISVKKVIEKWYAKFQESTNPEESKLTSKKTPMGFIQQGLFLGEASIAAMQNLIYALRELETWLRTSTQYQSSVSGDDYDSSAEEVEKFIGVDPTLVESAKNIAEKIYSRKYIVDPEASQQRMETFFTSQELSEMMASLGAIIQTTGQQFFSDTNPYSVEEEVPEERRKEFIENRNQGATGDWRSLLTDNPEAQNAYLSKYGLTLDQFLNMLPLPKDLPEDPTPETVAKMKFNAFLYEAYSSMKERLNMDPEKLSVQFPEMDLKFRNKAKDSKTKSMEEPEHAPTPLNRLKSSEYNDVLFGVMNEMLETNKEGTMQNYEKAEFPVSQAMNSALIKGFFDSENPGIRKLSQGILKKQDEFILNNAEKFDKLKDSNDLDNPTAQAYFNKVVQISDRILQVGQDEKTGTYSSKSPELLSELINALAEFKNQFDPDGAWLKKNGILFRPLTLSDNVSLYNSLARDKRPDFKKDVELIEKELSDNPIWEVMKRMKQISASINEVMKIAAGTQVSYREQYKSQELVNLRVSTQSTYALLYNFMHAVPNYEQRLRNIEVDRAENMRAIKDKKPESTFLTERMQVVNEIQRKISQIYHELVDYLEVFNSDFDSIVKQEFQPDEFATPEQLKPINDFIAKIANVKSQIEGHLGSIGKFIGDRSVDTQQMFEQVIGTELAGVSNVLSGLSKVLKDPKVSRDRTGIHFQDYEVSFRQVDEKRRELQRIMDAFSASNGKNAQAYFDKFLEKSLEIREILEWAQTSVGGKAGKYMLDLDLEVQGLKDDLSSDYAGQLLSDHSADASMVGNLVDKNEIEEAKKKKNKNKDVTIPNGTVKTVQNSDGKNITGVFIDAKLPSIDFVITDPLNPDDEQTVIYGIEGMNAPYDNKLKSIKKDILLRIPAEQSVDGRAKIRVREFYNNPYFGEYQVPNDQKFIIREYLAPDKNALKTQPQQVASSSKQSYKTNAVHFNLRNLVNANKRNP